MYSKYTEKIKSIIDVPWMIFLVIGFVFGSIFLFLTPPLEVPDEDAHLLRACEVASGIFYNKTPTKETKYDKLFQYIYIRENNDLKNINPKYTLKRDPKNFHYGSRNSAVMYIPSSIGIKISSLFSSDKNFIFYTGRFLNLIVYLFLCVIAIKITPVFKYQFMFTALLPMALFEGMSYSADSFNNGFAFLFFAFLFKLIYGKKEISPKNFSILAIMCGIGALCKGLIYPLCLFFTLPEFSKKFKLKRWIYILALIILTLILCKVWISINYKNLNYRHEIINDSLYFVKYPFIVAKKIIVTTYTNLWKYTTEFIGVLGWLNIFLYKSVYITAISVYSSMFIFLKEKITKSQRLFAFLGLITFYSLIQYTQLIYWSNPNLEIIEGFQGRYIIPLTPLLFVAFTNSQWNFNEKFIKLYKLLLIMFITCLLIQSCYTLDLFYNEHNLNRFLIEDLKKYLI